ncbi:MAG: glycosyltransferase WbuB [Acidimicrobiales bacterium]|nr:MAG: glycosyltransferase WbuB [Acidimicrobiales bacterium]
MKIQVLCPHFEPDSAPTGEFMTAIVENLGAMGHELHVITALPWYREHAIEEGWSHRLVQSEDRPWGRISRVHPFPTDKTNIAARAMAFAGFTTAGLVTAVSSRFDADIVFAMSPPMTLGVAAWVAAKRRGVPFVFNIQDVFPDVAIETGTITSPRVISAAKKLEAFVYDKADVVTVLSEEMDRNVIGKTDTPTEIIPNFVDIETFAPTPLENSYREEFGLVGKRVVMYCGNVGFSQSIELLAEAAREMPDLEDVMFVVNGGGSSIEEVRRRSKGLKNFKIIPYQPVERVPEVLAAADVHVIPLRKGLAWSSVPSKLYKILAVKRPVIASVDEGTEVGNVVVEAAAGRSVPPDVVEPMVEALRELLDSADLRVAMGERGRDWVEQWVTPRRAAERYEALFTRLTAEVP